MGTARHGTAGQDCSLLVGTTRLPDFLGPEGSPKVHSATECLVMAAAPSVHLRSLYSSSINSSVTMLDASSRGGRACSHVVIDVQKTTALLAAADARVAIRGRPEEAGGEWGRVNHAVVITHRNNPE